MTQQTRLHAQMTKLDDLSIDLLKHIFSRLTSRDIARASIVSKGWRTVASTMLKFDNPPLLLYFPNRNCDLYSFNNFSRGTQNLYSQRPNNPYDFYDFSLGQAYHLKFPDNPRGIICHARDGWILIFEHYTRQMILFSPFTEPLIQLPKLQVSFYGAAFSAPPTSSNCVIFTMYETTDEFVHISTCRPGDNSWTSAIYLSHFPFVHCLYNSIAICNGIFYCMCLSGRVGAFDPEQRTWKVLAIEPTTCTMALNNNDRERRQFMAEYNGNIYSVRTTQVVQPIVYLLDETRNEWVKVKDLGGATFFANAITSLIRMDMPGFMRDCICFHAINRTQCARYSLINKRYYPEDNFDLCELDRLCRIWINAPQDRSIFEAYPA